MRHDAPPTREAALERVLARREAGRARPPLVRAGVAAAGALLLVACVPLVVLVPELGLPTLLVALRLLAVEALWAARAYAWVTWRWGQARAWFARLSGPARAAVLVVLLALAAGLVWLAVHALGPSASTSLRTVAQVRVVTAPATARAAADVRTPSGRSG